jgi:hypothetical protein
MANPTTTPAMEATVPGVREPAALSRFPLLSSLLPPLLLEAEVGWEPVVVVSWLMPVGRLAVTVTPSMMVVALGAKVVLWKLHAVIISWISVKKKKKKKRTH